MPIWDSRRALARTANFGMVIFGLAVLTIIGTGGTQIRLPGVSIGLHSLANPLQGLFLFGALRLLLTRHGAGLEGALIRFYARQGLAPRHGPATRRSAVVAGAWLGAGTGVAVALVDLANLYLTAPHPSPTALSLMGAGVVDASVGALAGAAVGAALGLSIVSISLATGHRPSRYSVGRWIVAGLMVLTPLLVRYAPVQIRTGSPLVQMALAATSLISAGVVFLLLPAAILRARRGRWGLAVSGGALLALALGVVAIGTLGAPPVTTSTGGGVHQNILLISITGLRVDSLGSKDGSRAPTPNLDLLAARGASFERAITPSTSTVRAASSMLTGLYPSSLALEDGRWRWYPENLPDLVSSHGYRTGAFVSSRALMGASSGLADFFETYDDLTSLRDWLDRLALSAPLSSASRRPRPQLRDARDVVDGFRDWVAPQSGTPWFAWLQFGGPARPKPRPILLEAVAELRGLPLPPAWAEAGEASMPLDAWLRGYREEIVEADAAVGEVLELIRARGEQHRTLVFVVAEHGIALGEGGSWFEVSRALPEGVIHVPWIAYVPGASSSLSIAGPASLVDVVPTVLGLTGLVSGRQSEGEDLSRYLIVNGGAPRDPNSGPVFSEGGGEEEPVFAVRFGNYKLVREADGTERFYDVTGAEREIISVRGRQDRVRLNLSDMLTRRLAEQERWQP